MLDMHASYCNLMAFLEDGFDDEELRQLAFAGFCGDEIHSSISGAGASRRELAFDIVTLVSQHYGAPPASLWSYLYAERPHRRQEITRIHLGFGGDPAREVDESEHGPRGLVVDPQAVCLPDEPRVVVRPERAEAREREHSRGWDRADHRVCTSPVVGPLVRAGDLQAVLTAASRCHGEARIDEVSHDAFADMHVNA